MVVTRLDGDYVWGVTSLAAEAMPLSLTRADETAPECWQWNSLRPHIHPGTQLNLVAPKHKDGILSADIIVLEPDYLVDISAVAACFEDFGVTPLTYLLRQLQPRALSSAILMGEMASMLLDEELSLPDEERSYEQTARRFFHANALAIMATPMDRTFHRQARQQAQHIHHAIKHVLPQLRSDFDPAEVMLEPSFFCQMLGLQGRMDFLTSDYTLLIEQKGGKCGFPQPSPDTPVQARKHYVQMLLYMLLLRYNYGIRPGNEADAQPMACLLYSRYANSLLPLGFDSELVFQAMRLRNDIVAAEYRGRREGFGYLATLTADDFNTRGVSGKLWNNYQRPQIEAMLAPIRDASPTERAYFLRMLRFWHNEHLLQKVTARELVSHGTAEMWRCTLAQKQEAGSIVAAMKLVSPTKADTGHVAELHLQMAAGIESDVADFRQGDIVVVYPYEDGTEPDACRTMVFRATITHMVAGVVRLRLRSTQTDAHMFMRWAHQPWAMEHDFMESSFSAGYKALHAFLCAPKSRRDLLLCKRRPAYDDGVRLCLDHGSFNTLALAVAQAQDLFIIIGPPGTGKTSYGLMTTVREQLARNSNSDILLTAFTNRAVDEICSKLMEDGIDFVRMGGTAQASDELQPYLLDNRIRACGNVDEVRNILAQTRIVVGTTTAITAGLPLLGSKHFDVAVVDEASQILEPQMLALWCGSIRKFVLIGDHKQLPAVVQQGADDARVDEPLLHEIGLTDCRASLFERLLKHYRHDPHVTYMLTRQGRMHPDVANFASRYFYGGLLHEVGLPHQQQPSTHPRTVFIDVKRDESMDNGQWTMVNEAEANVIAKICLDLRQHASFSHCSIGVIVPYRGQVAAVRRRLDACPSISQSVEVTVDTVERYQGSQRDVIIYGFTVSRAYQLDFLTSSVFVDEDGVIDRRLNVALTRAREQIIIIGNAALLSQNAVFSRLIEHIKECDGYVEISPGETLEYLR